MINIPQRILLGPGPSDVPPRVLSALARPTIGHLDPVFLQLMDDIRGGLREVFRTSNEMTLAVVGDHPRERGARLVDQPRELAQRVAREARPGPAGE